MNPLDQWEYPKAAAYFDDFVKQEGNPIGWINAPGGIAIWKGDGNPWLRHELRDEYVEHRFPAKHHDFFTNFVQYDIPDDRVWDVLRLSGSVSYDPLKRELGARCGGIGANIASVYMAIKIAEGDLDIRKVQLHQLYDQAIQASKDPESRKSMLEYINGSVEQNKVRTIPCWKLAFPDRC